MAQATFTSTQPNSIQSTVSLETFSKEVTPSTKKDSSKGVRFSTNELPARSSSPRGFLPSFRGKGLMRRQPSLSQLNYDKILSEIQKASPPASRRPSLSTSEVAEESGCLFQSETSLSTQVAISLGQVPTGKISSGRSRSDAIFSFETEVSDSTKQLIASLPASRRPSLSMSATTEENEWKLDASYLPEREVGLLKKWAGIQFLAENYKENPEAHEDAFLVSIKNDAVFQASLLAKGKDWNSFSSRLFPKQIILLYLDEVSRFMRITNEHGVDGEPLSSLAKKLLNRGRRSHGRGILTAMNQLIQDISYGSRRASLSHFSTSSSRSPRSSFSEMRKEVAQEFHSIHTVRTQEGHFLRLAPFEAIQFNEASIPDRLLLIKEWAKQPNRFKYSESFQSHDGRATTQAEFEKRIERLQEEKAKEQQEIRFMKLLIERGKKNLKPFEKSKSNYEKNRNIHKKNLEGRMALFVLDYHFSLMCECLAAPHGEEGYDLEAIKKMPVLIHRMIQSGLILKMNPEVLAQTKRGLEKSQAAQESAPVFV